jgi:hypothetical protein
MVIKDEAGLNDWLDDVKANEALPNGKGIVTAILHPEVQKTKFGDRKTVQIVIEGADKSVIHTNLFLPPNFPALHPKSSLAKIMKKYGCKTMHELLGKTVEVISVGEMFWKIKEE